MSFLKLAITLWFFVSGISYGILITELNSYNAEEVAVLVSLVEDSCPFSGEEIAQLEQFETVILGGLK